LAVLASLAVTSNRAHHRYVPERIARKFPDEVRLKSIASTTQRREVWLVTLGHQCQTASQASSPMAGTSSPTSRVPAILIVANLEADYIIGSQVAIQLIDHIA
jgi:Zinc carboxypeptidase